MTSTWSMLGSSATSCVVVRGSALIIDHWSFDHLIISWSLLTPNGQSLHFSSSRLSSPFPIWNQSVVPCPVLTVASWPVYKFLKRQVRWSGIPISWRIFHSIIAFWIPEKPVYLRSMLRKLICTENCNSCRWHWSTERAQFFSPTIPTHTLHNQHFKSWMNWATTFCLICHIHLTFPKLTTIFSSISTTLCRENASITSRRPKMLFKSSSKPGAWIFTRQE